MEVFGILSILHTKQKSTASSAYGYLYSTFLHFRFLKNIVCCSCVHVIISLLSIPTPHATIPAALCEYFGQVSVCGTSGITRIGNQSGLKFCFHKQDKDSPEAVVLFREKVLVFLEIAYCVWRMEKSLKMCIILPKIRKDPRLTKLALLWSRKKGLQQV